MTLPTSTIQQSKYNFTNQYNSAIKIWLYQPVQFSNQNITLPTSTIQQSKYNFTNQYNSAIKILLYQPVQFSN